MIGEVLDRKYEMNTLIYSVAQNQHAFSIIYMLPNHLFFYVLFVLIDSCHSTNQSSW